MAITTIRAIPYQCIWCLKDRSGAAFDSESHVLPKCIGNIAKQVLPKGVVCDKCNKYFGIELEPRFIEDPIISTQVAILGFRDLSSQFTYKHSFFGVHRTAQMVAKVSANRITLTTYYEIEGQPNKPNEFRTITKCKDYDQKALAVLSRAVHKISFESVAHNLFVGTGLVTHSKEMPDVDIFDRRFDAIRDWGRNGKPQNSVRPVLRIQKFDEVERQEQLWDWGGRVVRFQGCIYYELNLFHDWYIVSLTSPTNEVEGDLMNWLEKGETNRQVWMVGDTLQLIK